jgi:hypothetical protein
MQRGDEFYPPLGGTRRQAPICSEHPEGGPPDSFELRRCMTITVTTSSLLIHPPPRPRPLLPGPTCLSRTTFSGAAVPGPDFWKLSVQILLFPSPAGFML